MKSLDALDVTSLEARLRLERQALLDHIGRQLHGSGDPKRIAMAGRVANVDDWTAPDLQADIGVALSGHEFCGLRDIDMALKHIAKGDYGLCGNCGKPIDLRRLNAQPTARLCLSCKEAFEKRRGIVTQAAL